MIRFGIVGTNFISDEFMKGASLIPDKIKVTSVCSGRLENAKKFAEKYKIENTFANHIEMMESGEIDAIYIATPNSMHFQMTLDALERKMPTFCEKPLAVNLKQAEQMVDLAIKNKTYLHHGVVPLFNENYPILKNFLKEIGQVRRVVLAQNQYSSRYDGYLSGQNPTTFRNELANGAIMDLGIYVLSICIGLFGKPKKIMANSIMLESQVDGATSAILTYDDFEAIIMCSKIVDSQLVSEISGEKGYITIGKPSLLRDLSLYKRETKKTSPISVDYDHQFRWELEEFYKVVTSGGYESEILPYKLSLDIIEVLTEIRRQTGIKYREDN